MQMHLDLVVTISLHFYERCQTKREMFEISDLRRREILHLRPVCPFSPGKYFHTYIGRGFFFGSTIFCFVFFRKLNIFGGMKILLIFFWVITKLDYI